LWRVQHKTNQGIGLKKEKKRKEVVFLWEYVKRANFKKRGAKGLCALKEKEMDIKIQERAQRRRRNFV